MAGVRENGQHVPRSPVSWKQAERGLAVGRHRLDERTTGTFIFLQQNRARAGQGNISSAWWDNAWHTPRVLNETMQVSVSRDSGWERGAVRCCLSQVLTAGKCCWLEVLACMWPAGTHYAQQTDNVLSYTLLSFLITRHRTDLEEFKCTHIMLFHLTKQTQKYARPSEWNQIHLKQQQMLYQVCY